mmetsp:Transcript_15340/g.48181  ORF Transcript_15340/g.48181 Transcript_15340/m.48181 type:complete len:225 (+) Transcript_15340:1363-2037(+)
MAASCGRARSSWSQGLRTRQCTTWRSRRCQRSLRRPAAAPWAGCGSRWPEWRSACRSCARSSSAQGRQRRCCATSTCTEHRRLPPCDFSGLCSSSSREMPAGQSQRWPSSRSLWPAAPRRPARPPICTAWPRAPGSTCVRRASRDFERYCNRPKSEWRTCRQKGWSVKCFPTATSSSARWPRSAVPAFESTSAAPCVGPLSMKRLNQPKLKRSSSWVGTRRRRS